MIRVIFAGGKDIGCGCLRLLLWHPQINVVSVFANPGNNITENRWFCSIANLAASYDIPVFTPRNINYTYTVRQIRELEPDLIVAVYYDQILKSEIIDIPRLGCINLHMALAEEYRGCYPTTWAILNGEERTGVTLHYIDEGIDTGDIIAQKTVGISLGDTGKTLYDKCTVAGIELFKENIPLFIEGNTPRHKQVTTWHTKYHKREFPSHEIVFNNRRGENIYDRIRALYFPPFPFPYFYIGDRKMVIVEEKFLNENIPNG